MTTGDTQFGLTCTDTPGNVDHELSQTLTGIASVQASASSGANQGMTSKSDMSSSSSRLADNESQVNGMVKPKPPSTLHPLGLSNAFLPNHENVLSTNSGNSLTDSGIRSTQENDPDAWLDDAAGATSWNGNVDVTSSGSASVDQTGVPIYSNGVHAEDAATVVPNYFESLAFSPDYHSSGAFSPIDFNPQSAPYLSPQQAAAAAAAVGFSPFYNISPDYPSWAQGPGTFDFAPTLTSPVDTNASLKLLEQNFTNLSLFAPAAAGSPLHAIDFANYQALFPAGKSKSYTKITGQPTAVGNSSRNFQKPRQQRWNNGVNSNPFGGPPPHHRQNTNSYYHRPQHPQTMPDIGTWGYNEDFSAANKTMTRSGKIVPTPSEKENEVLRKLKQNNNYNPVDFNCSPKEAKFFVIKSYSEDDIHRSIKYKIWCSTERGNRKLNDCYGRFHHKGPIYLMFSVNGSGHFCGVAEMKSFVDLETQQKVWSQSKWKGSFDVEWIFVKDVPNSQLRHIRLENNENKPVTNSRDTQEIPFEKGKLILKVFHKYEHETSLFDDFSHYESRELEANAGTAAGESDLQHNVNSAAVAVGLDTTLVPYQPLSHFTVPGENGANAMGAEGAESTDCITTQVSDSLLVTASPHVPEGASDTSGAIAVAGTSNRDNINPSTSKESNKTFANTSNCSELNSSSFDNSCPVPSTLTSQPTNLTSIESTAP